MEIEQSFTVPYPRELVWARFHDTPGIVGCLPGASLAAPVENGMLKLTMTVKLGPIVASFAGDGEIAFDDAHYTGSITGAGVDRKSSSRVKGVASFALEEAGAGETRVDVKVDYTIGGTLAQFSRGGIVKELATRMTEAFASNLKAKLDQAGASASVDDTAEATHTAREAREAREAQIVQQAAVAQASMPEAQASAREARAHVPADKQPKAQPEAQARPQNPPRAVVRPQPANAPLDVGNLFWKMLWSRLRSLFSFAGR
ncbi:hypothetical protein R8871_06434 [Paraburkholderia graminis C4D1M]|jgi:carbon monoxide dehydrogenase subunit G|uniref:Carbon monoxide dehydrogenase subunit G n=1 Tax=Paraburkholderia graminis (strain ATCC 700544 / DSM 17151 / LMG 18924 / NCIMB 13744 / C4D1M) TaxID=396598 RepID=B1G667_PARG4|nr:SRPBCC family protein [Paraburkholderia graminis]EDT08347.1 carbon monoxide dehydrogenase subunit G [Paraburkholderia graminis C4D1M]CAB3738694.1 hypothetical protein R8871_06434 [Paraburkholderia graminis C4D1M]